MITNSNLYAERIFSEHPLALWPLDENITYLQLFSDSRQDLGDSGNWTLTNLTESLPVSYSNTPIGSSPSSRFTLTSSASYSSNIVSSFTLNSSSDFNDSRSTACFSTHVYQGSVFIESFEIGVIYDGVEYYSQYIFESDVGWHKIFHTFDLPSNKNLTFFIRTNYSDVGSLSDFVTQFNGVSLGQWSEQFNASNLGFNYQDFPANLEHLLTSGSAYSSVVLDSYGTDTDMNGYYLLKNNKIYAENAGIPMVFGSNHTTRIIEAPDGNPSIMFPGNGFLNDSGKYNNYTLEAWIRLDNVSADPIKIIGPIESTDGVYVEEGFISIKIGFYVKSYFVGKWYRPMLVHFKYSEIEASLLINGEQVITMPFDLDNITFPSKSSSASLEQDWIGVYGNDLISPFEIDCISIVPYLIPLEMAKRRFVYGQGVPEINRSNDTFLTNSTLFDYSFADYASNILYPDVTPWRSGYANNLDTTSTYMTTPGYNLPDVQLKRNSRFLSTLQWFQENKTANDENPDQFTYFLMKPLFERERSRLWSEVYNSGATDWQNVSASTWYDSTHEFFVNEDIFYSDITVYYDSLNILTDRLASVVGVFKSPESSVISQTLLLFKNKTTGATIDISLNINLLSYIYTSPAGVQTVLKNEVVEDNEYFVAGINLSDIESSKYSIIGNFFSVLDSISLNIGGYFENSFAGKIFAIHFNNSFFHKKDMNDFFSNGFVDQTFETQNVAGELIEYTANYSLLPVEQDNIVSLDIGVAGYWEDIQPLSFFGKYVNDRYGDSYYDLDMLQFNIDAPKRSELDEALTQYLTYGALDLLYARYSDLSNIILTGYANYTELANEGAIEVAQGRFDTNVLTYLSFQRYVDVGKKPYSDFTNVEDVSYNNVVSFDSSAYLNTKYEIVDNTIIFPPKTPDFKDYYLGIHLEIKVRGINKKKLLLRRMELASLAFDDSSAYAVGTKYSNSVYPFARTKYLFDYKQKNPFTIYKDSSPYLYLTEYSGIYVNPFESDYTRGVLVPLNKNKEDLYSVGGLQFWSRYPLNVFPETPFIVAKIKTETTDIDFYLQPESGGKRAFLKSYSYLTGQEVETMSFFQDGIEVKNPIFYPRQWSAVNISFLDPINSDNFTGKLELYSGLVFNNIVEYNYTEPLLDTSKTVYKTWFQVYTDETENNAINYWQDILIPEGEVSETSWRLATASLVANQRTINGEVEYNSQVGLSVSVTEDISSLNIYSNGSDLFTDVKWKTFESSPV